jgi:hypothetical protein
MSKKLLLAEHASRGPLPSHPPATEFGPPVSASA